MNKIYITPAINVIKPLPFNIVCSSGVKKSVSTSSEDARKKEIQTAIDNIQAVLDNYHAEQKKQLPETISPEDKFHIYGIDLKNSPDETWKFTKVETGMHKEKIEKFEKDIESVEGETNIAHPFSVCEAIVLEKATNFVFKPIRYSEDNALNLIFPFVRNFMRNGNYSHEECRKKYLEQTQQTNNTINLNSIDNSLHFALNINDETMSVTIHTNLMSPNKPKVAEDFVPDMTEIFLKAKEMLGACCVICSLYGEKAGTPETIENTNTVTFVPIKQDLLSDSDKQRILGLQKYDELLIEKDNTGYVLYTREKDARVGNVPSNLDLALNTLYENNWINRVSINTINGYNLTIDLVIGM